MTDNGNFFASQRRRRKREENNWVYFRISTKFEIFLGHLAYRFPSLLETKDTNFVVGHLMEMFCRFHGVGFKIGTFLGH